MRCLLLLGQVHESYRVGMMSRRTWSRDELIVVFSLYCRLPFGLFHARNADVIDIARRIDRTPGTVAMKLCNFASLDPAHQQRGVRGLANASDADKRIWKEFTSDWDGAVLASEEILSSFGLPSEPAADVKIPDGPTTVSREVQTRRGQAFFRQAVLSSYRMQCCITGNPLPELLRASHILPWGEFPQHRLNPSNGLCLSSLHDAAFDRGLITVDDAYRLVLSREIKHQLSIENIEVNFARYEGKSIHLPDKFMPDMPFLQQHRRQIFRG